MIKENCDRIFLIKKQDKLKQACAEYLKYAENDESLYVGYNEVKCNERVYGYECFHALRDDQKENLINKYNINLIWPDV